LIRKYLHRDYWSKPYYQYNSIMLTRILADNPGMTFTRNLDKKYIDAVRELLKNGRDPSVRQMLMETLDAFETTKPYDDGLTPLVEMWKKEKEKAYKAYGVSRQHITSVVGESQANMMQRDDRCRRRQWHNMGTTRSHSTHTRSSIRRGVGGLYRTRWSWPTGWRSRAHRPSCWSSW
jgi:hypothetical protein